MQGGMKKSRFSTYIVISSFVSEISYNVSSGTLNPTIPIPMQYTSSYLGNDKDTAIVTTEREQETLPKFSNGAIFNDLEWLLTMISRSRYYSTSTGKWYKIELYLQWQTNSKSYMIYRTAPFSTTLNDPYLHFKVTSLFDAEYLRNGTRYWHNFNGILIGIFALLITEGVFSNDLEWLSEIFNDMKRRAVSATAELLV